MISPQLLPVLPPALDYAGVTVFALTGALAAARDRHDIITFWFFAVVTGVGGGTLRDLLIGAPVFWIGDATYLGIGLAAALAVWFLAPPAPMIPRRSRQRRRCCPEAGRCVGAAILAWRQRHEAPRRVDTAENDVALHDRQAVGDPVVNRLRRGRERKHDLRRARLGLQGRLHAALDLRASQFASRRRFGARTPRVLCGGPGCHQCSSQASKRKACRGAHGDHHRYLCMGRMWFPARVTVKQSRSARRLHCDRTHSALWRVARASDGASGGS